MSTRTIAQFDVTGWDGTPYDEPAQGPGLSRVSVRKSFRGDLEGESVGELLMCANADPETGAGYVVSERFTGTLGGRQGTFVLQHGGIVGPGIAPHSFGNVVPGSGTGELTRLRGTTVFDRTAEGHTLTLDYDFGES